MNSNSKKPVTLVIGGESVIGAALLKSLKNSGKPSLGTTRRKESVSESRPYLDLSGESVSWDHPNPVETVIFCAGVSSLEDCRANPIRSRRINVEATCALANVFSSRGAFVIFLSSSRVFDGSVPFPTVEDSMSPVTEYGRQKAEVERSISQLTGPAAIVRLTKVIGPNIPLFEYWARTMRSGRPIHPFEDLYFAPVPLSTVVLVLKLTSDQRLSGILQISGERDVSYAESARLGARLLKVDPTLVQPIKASSSGKVVEQVESLTALDVERLKRIFDIQLPLVSSTLNMAFLNPQLLG